MNNRELTHYGILGQKWGVRRFQYENGSYTPEGKERYGRIATPDQIGDEQKQSAVSNNGNNVKKLLIGAGIVSLAAVGGYLAYKGLRNKDTIQFPKSWPKSAIRGEKGRQTLLEDFNRRVLPKLSDEEKQAINSYTGDDYEKINYLLEKKRRIWQQ